MNPLEFLGFLHQVLQQRTISPTPPETAYGLRPQSDQATRLIINALRGEPNRGIGPNQPGQAAGNDVSLQRIIQAALQSPGSIPVFMRNQREDPGLGGQLESGLKGTTISSTDRPNQARVNLYPEQNAPGQLFNTLPHELLHAMRMNQGINTQGSGLEEALAYYGTGSPMTAWSTQLAKDNNNPNPAAMQPTLDQLLKALLAGAPETSPSNNLPQLGEPQGGER
jgi:hypothetical protein